MNRGEIAKAAAVFRERYPHFIRRTPLWKLPGSALGVDCREVLESIPVVDGFELA